MPSLSAFTSNFRCCMFETARIKFEVGLILRERKGFHARAISHLSTLLEIQCRSVAGTLTVYQLTASPLTTEFSYR